ncbi:unnamed protein product, partial [Closterium sp. Naga37s-1]
PDSLCCFALTASLAHGSLLCFVKCMLTKGSPFSSLPLSHCLPLSASSLALSLLSPSDFLLLSLFFPSSSPPLTLHPHSSLPLPNYSGSSSPLSSSPASFPPASSPLSASQPTSSPSSLSAPSLATTPIVLASDSVGVYKQGPSGHLHLQLLIWQPVLLPCLEHVVTSVTPIPNYRMR